MAEFTIKMADERGRVLEQVESGFSASDVRDRFSQQGFLVYSIKPRGFVSSGLRLASRRKVKLDTFVIFNSQFLTLIRAGLPIVNALDLLIKRQRNKQFQALLENVRDRVKGGELLSDAFAAQGAFPKIYPTTLLAGEKSGNLEEVLSRYINFQRMAMTFRKKLKASLVYPALLSVMVTCMLDLPDDLRRSEVRRALCNDQHGKTASCSHVIHACCRAELTKTRAVRCSRRSACCRWFLALEKLR